ncbi:MAG: alpha/beta hydrolase [Deltaproteobacteria bacterium]|nr:MAG: alpha/beta hydrolase [Deltaproteobacteria bacterium]
MSVTTRHAVVGICLSFVLFGLGGLLGCGDAGPAEYTVTVTTQAHGLITVLPEQDRYEEGTEVHVCATAATGYTFAGWAGDLSGTENPTRIVVEQNLVIDATFEAVPPMTYTLTVVQPKNGTLTVYPEQDTYVTGTMVSITATPATGYRFVGWTGDLAGDTNPAIVTMNRDKAISASFEPYEMATHTVSVLPSAHGVIRLTPDLARYEAGSQVMVTAKPFSGYSFAGWLGDLSGTDNPTTLTMDADKVIGASFAEHIVTTWELTVVQPPEGRIIPIGGTYEDGAEVTLRWLPDTAGCFEVSAWTGDASGVGATTTLVMSADRTVGAEVARPLQQIVVEDPPDGFISMLPQDAETAFRRCSYVTVRAGHDGDGAFRLAAWTGDLAGVVENPHRFQVMADMRLGARFEEAWYTVYPAENPEHGSFTTDVPLSEEGTLLRGGSIVTVTPAADPGYVLDSVFAVVEGPEGPEYRELLAAPYEITVDRDGMAVGAYFVPREATTGIRTTQDVPYATTGWRPLVYDVFEPAAAHTGLPGVILVHDGGWTAGDEDAARGVGRMIAKTGRYVAFSVDYRGLGLAEGTVRPATMATLIEDVLGAMRHIQRHAAEYGVDPNRLALAGEGSGGHLAAAVATMLDRVGVGGFVEGVWQLWPTGVPEVEVACAALELEEALRVVVASYGAFAAIADGDPEHAWSAHVSPIDNVPEVSERALPPQLLVRGELDEEVTAEAQGNYAITLALAGQPVTTTTLTGAGHGFLAWRPDDETVATFEDVGRIGVGLLLDRFDVDFYGAEPGSHRVNVEPVDAGVVTLWPPGGVYPEGTEVTVTWVPDDEGCYALDRWTGDGSGASSSFVVVVDGDKTVGASVSRPRTALTVVNPPGGAIEAYPASVAGMYPRCSYVTVKATPSDDSGAFRLASWSGALAGATDNPHTLRLMGDVTVGASFEEAWYAVRPSQVAAHGSFKLDLSVPAGGSVVRGGTVVTVEATPDEGYVLDAVYEAVDGPWTPFTGVPLFKAHRAPPYAVTVGQDEVRIGAYFVPESVVAGVSETLDVVYARPGVKPLVYDVYEPAALHEGLPAVIVVHGGGWDEGDEDAARGVGRALAQTGRYVAFAVDYRWAGLADGDVRPTTTADLIADVFGAIYHVMGSAAAYGVDPTRIAVTGDDAGGHLAAAMATLSDRIGTGGFVEGVWEIWPTGVPEAEVAPFRVALQASLRAVEASYGWFAAVDDHDAEHEWDAIVSPIANVPYWTERVLPVQRLTRGGADFLVTGAALQAYASALAAQGQPVSMATVVGGGHGYLEWQPHDAVVAAFEGYGMMDVAGMVAFFDGVFYP